MKKNIKIKAPIVIDDCSCFNLNEKNDLISFCNQLGINIIEISMPISNNKLIDLKDNFVEKSEYKVGEV
jgi:hypothetical protein